MSFRNWVNESPTVKLAVIGILTLVLLIPSAFVMSLIHERSQRQQEALTEVSSKWGAPQTITGPVISVPYKKAITTDNVAANNVANTANRGYIHILPEKLGITGKITPELRYRGIYKVIVYNADLSLAGTINKPTVNITGIKDEDILWEDASIYVGIDDIKGIKNNINFKINNVGHEAMPGVDTRDICSTGLSAKINLRTDSLMAFQFNLSINGTESLNFIPVGKETTVKLTSTWPSPSFNGAYLPDTQADISANGFAANWSILYLNRSFPQVWADDGYQIRESAFGVNLNDGVNHYDKTTRSAKYAIMFLALTFLAFFLTEVLSKTKIHIIQYVLIGIALCIFYVLLLSLSEQIGFNMAYLVASLAVIFQITFYANSFLKERKNSLMVFLVLAALYGFLFTTLQLEDYALLIGSLALFLILSLTMYLSRKVDWNGLQINGSNNTPTPTEEKTVD